MCGSAQKILERTRLLGFSEKRLLRRGAAERKRNLAIGRSYKVDSKSCGRGPKKKASRNQYQVLQSGRCAAGRKGWKRLGKFIALGPKGNSKTTRAVRDGDSRFYGRESDLETTRLEEIRKTQKTLIAGK